MSRRIVFCAALAALAALATASRGDAQLKPGTITGVVRDIDKRPMPDVVVALRPGGRRVKTDSVGHYEFSGVTAGSYIAVARKIGWRDEHWDIAVPKAGGATADFLLAVPDPDPIVPDGKRKCEGLSLRGFECRKSVANGMFFDFPDIDTENRVMTADLFRDIPGFRVTLQRTSSGQIAPFVETSRGGSCIYYFTDGKPSSAANPVPPQSRDVHAMEIYRSADSVPVTDMRELRRGTNVGTLGNCRIVLVWTTWSRTS